MLSDNGSMAFVRGGSSRPASGMLNCIAVDLPVPSRLNGSTKIQEGSMSKSIAPAHALAGKGKPYRVGILGLGHWYAAFGLARGLREYAKAELVACACPDVEKANTFASTFGINAYTSYETFIEEADVDIVLIASPVSAIPYCTDLAARAGKHIILGKPMAMTLDQAREMVTVVEEAGIVCVPFQVIARLGAMGVKRRIENNEIGDVAVMHQTSRWSIAEDWYQSGKPGWFVDPKHVPGGALIDEGIYAIEMFSWLAGSEIVTVEARMANIVHKELEVEDWGMATFTLRNGVIATLEASWTINSPRKTGPSPKQNAVVRLEVVGTRGEISRQYFRDPGLAVLSAGADNWVFEREAGGFFGPASVEPLATLVACLEENRQPPATINDAYHSFAAALAAYTSVREGKPIHLADLA